MASKQRNRLPLVRADSMPACQLHRTSVSVQQSQDVRFMVNKSMYVLRTSIDKAGRIFINMFPRLPTAVLTDLKAIKGQTYVQLVPQATLPLGTMFRLPVI